MLTHACELDQNHLFEKVIRKCRIWSSKGRVLTICRGNIVLKRWRENALVYFDYTKTKIPLHKDVI